MSKTKIYGHRGSKGDYPENTLLSFEQAIVQGVDGIELDVHLTKDNEVVVIHDERIDRTTNGEGYIKDISLQQLQQYSAGSGFSHYKYYRSDWNSEKIPTLREVLALLGPYETELNIEFKTYLINYDGIEEKVLNLVQEFGNKRKVVYSSFHLPTLIRIKQLDQSAEIAWLLQQPITQPQDYLASLDLESLHINKTVLLANEVYWKRNSPSIRAWTANDQDDIKRLLTLEVEAIITDFPELALTLRNERAIPFG
ncbi:glycerophosphodiester phosphodiesterase [Paraliobacillus sediminis]|uniref:glycerophosphodiester phosphodiesterase n=1 Tax=Paraliobacillus sediminis TaxID=1885916 RepID=UPI000E3DDB69|nr:glycerophosphodiester phosphodiesterase [Paraliobacillus sediminis]